MRKFIVGCMTLSVGLVVATAASAAPPKASTAKVPAALRALGHSQAKVLTSSQARQIRGQGAPKFGPHDPAIKFPANHYTGNRNGQDLKRGSLK